jgi:hypothetical protein
MYENNIYLSADLLHTGQEINMLPWIYTIIEVKEQQLQLMANQCNIYSILVQNIYCTVLECTVLWIILIQQLTRQIDLLKIETHVHRDNFLNILGSFYQPTRITDHSATLIDNIFLNLLQHFMISGIIWSII